MLEYLPIILSGAALLASLGLLFVHYMNLKERRHSELRSERRDILAKLNSAHQSSSSQLANLKVFRFGLRFAEDDGDKWEFIERLPSLIAMMENVESKLEGMLKVMNESNLESNNNSKGLLWFRELNDQADNLISDMDISNKSIIDVLNKYEVNPIKLKR